MVSFKSLARIAIVPVLGIFLLSVAGCGDGSVAVDPEGGAKLKQARIAAYGPSGATPGKPSSARTQDLSGQAARRQAQGGR